MRRAKAAPEGAGDIWTFTAIDADAKVILAYLVAGERDGETALAFMDDCATAWTTVRSSPRTASPPTRVP